VSFEVIDVTDPSLVTLMAPNGATLKAGRLTLVPAGDTTSG
jgi:hypothetical protein